MKEWYTVEWRNIDKWILFIGIHFPTMDEALRWYGEAKEKGAKNIPYRIVKHEIVEYTPEV